MFENITNTTNNQLPGNFACTVIWSMWLNETLRNVSFFMSILSHETRVPQFSLITAKKQSLFRQKMAENVYLSYLSEPKLTSADKDESKCVFLAITN